MTDEPDLFNLPELPYAGTSGFSGSETSEARARREDQDGTTSRRQAAALTILRSRGSEGCTWKELADALGVHHGSASGALSVLHKQERIARLKEKRSRCKIYVDLDFINGRESEPHGGSMKAGNGKHREEPMLTERQADILIDGQQVLVGQVARTLETLSGESPQMAAERIIGTIADWLSDYRPPDLGDDFCAPLDTTAFILRKGKSRE